MILFPEGFMAWSEVACASICVLGFCVESSVAQTPVDLA